MKDTFTHFNFILLEVEQYPFHNHPIVCIIKFSIIKFDSQIEILTQMQ